MSSDRLDILGRLHVAVPDSDVLDVDFGPIVELAPFCDECGDEWPCGIGYVLALLAERDAEVERLRGAGNTVSAHVYAMFNPGEIPVFVRSAMCVFEQAEVDKAKRKLAARAGGEGEQP
jgi:hypothetical protein